MGVAVAALTACSGGSRPTPSPSSTETGVAIAQSDVVRVAADAVPVADVQAAAAANNAFAVDLYAQIRASTPDGNLLTSPITASLALTMSYAGARAETATEMSKVLHLPEGRPRVLGQNALSQALLSRAAQALSGATRRAELAQKPAPAADDYQLELVNSVWGQTAYPWERPFLDTLAANYGTGVYQLDFKHAFEPARLTINRYVSDQTSDKINDLLPPRSLDDKTRLVLINALHLKLPWLNAFSRKQRRTLTSRAATPARFTATSCAASTTSRTSMTAKRKSRRCPCLAAICGWWWRCLTKARRSRTTRPR